MTFARLSTRHIQIPDKFHKAQADGDTLVVEVMLVVVCSQFARPIARVGLYIQEEPRSYHPQPSCSVSPLADVEGLGAHTNAVRICLREMEA